MMMMHGRSEFLLDIASLFGVVPSRPASREDAGEMLDTQGRCEHPQPEKQQWSVTVFQAYIISWLIVLLIIHLPCPRWLLLERRITQHPQHPAPPRNRRGIHWSDRCNTTGSVLVLNLEDASSIMTDSTRSSHYSEDEDDYDCESEVSVRSFRSANSTTSSEAQFVRIHGYDWSES